MHRSLPLAVVAVLSSPARAQWSEDFDSYAPGSTSVGGVTPGPLVSHGVPCVGPTGI